MYLLSGKVFCGICGNTFCGNRQVSTHGYKYVTYRCNTRSRKGTGGCGNKEINRDKLESYVLKLLADVLFDKNRIPAVIKEYNKSAADNLDSGKSERKAIQRLICRTEKEIENLVSVIASSGSAALAAGLEKKEADLVRLKNQLDDMNRQSTEPHVDNEQLIRVFNHSRELLMSGKLPKLKKLINLYVERIDIYPDVVNVTLNIMGSMLSQSDNSALAELGRISPDGLEINDSVSRADIKKF